MAETANRRGNPGTQSQGAKAAGNAARHARLSNISIFECVYSRKENEMRVKKEAAKRLGKKALALFLTLVMSVSMMQVTAFAADNSQIMEGSYEVGEDGEITADETGAAKIVDDTVTKDGFTLTKRISAASGDNQFNVTLQVVTQQVVTTKDAAVMVVIDNSGSMRFCAKCGSEYEHSKGCTYKGDVKTDQTRMTATIDALTRNGGFIDSLVSNNQTNNGGRIYVSVVKFDTTAETICGWTDITSGSGAATVKGTINSKNLDADGGTNLEAGLLLARNRLGMNDIAGVAPENKYTVLLTDGAPTFRVSDNSKATSTEEAGTDSTGGYTSDNNGSATSEAERTEARAVATEVKKLSKLYTICYGVSGEVLYTNTVDQCVHCGESKKNHTWFFGDYYCPDHSGTTYKATKNSVTVGEYLSGEIATAAAVGVTYAFNAGNDTDINNAFSNISSSSTSGMTGGGTAVTDPMGEFIVLGELSDALAEQGVVKNGNGITWSLDPEKAAKVTENGVTTYTYAVTYPITLNTAAEGFREGVYYPTNGYTYLSVPQADGTTKQLSFTVPGVCGEIPEYAYTVKFFKQGDAKPGDYANYTEITGDQAQRGPVDLHTTVSVTDVSANYQTKYTGDHYHYVYGAPVSMKVTVDESQNVMKLYYDKDTTSVTVNHYYKTNTWSADGSYTPGSYSDTPNAVTTSGPVYVGDSYTAEEEPEFGGAEYKFVSGNKTIDRLSENGEDNVLNLYYERTVDERADASVRVDHVYRKHSWVLKDGTYKLVTGSVTETGVESSDELKATTVYTAETAPANGYEDYTYDTESVNSITLKPGENVITLYFDYTEKEPDTVCVTVNHHYTKTVTAFVNGEPVTETVVDDHVETESLTIYKGENKTLTEQNVYHGETYASDEGNTGKLTLTNVQSNATVDLYYRLDEMPAKTSVTVVHTYRTMIHETVVTTDGNGEVTGTEVVDREPVVDSTDPVEVSDLYVGQSYTAALAGKADYDFNEEDSDELTATVQADGATTIELYYDRDENKDDRDAAEISVQHHYVTHLTKILDGEVKTVDVADGTETTGPVSGKAGDPFTAVPETTYHENEYSIVGTPVLEKVLQPGTNSTIVIDYEREDSALGDLVPYQVNYVYKTYVMYVDTDSTAKYAEPSVEAGTIRTGTPVTGSGYVGQYVDIEGKPEAGFAIEGTAPGARQTLAEEGNEWTFTYAKYEPLPQVHVTVNHHYTKTTIAVDGSGSSNTQHTYGTPVQKFVGETYAAEAAPNGYTYDRYTITEGIDAKQDEASKNVTLTASGDVTVDFYYSAVSDNSQPVSYTIRHIYKTVDWDGTVSTSEAPLIQGSSFATKQLSAATSIREGYSLVSATFNGTTIDGFDADDPQGTYAVTLVNSGNEIVYTYESKVDTRNDQDVSVKVMHRYFARDTYKVDASLTNDAYIASGGAAPEYTVEQMVIGKDNGVWIGASYTAVKQLTYTVGSGEGETTLVYTFVNAEPADLKVDLSEAGEYEITVNYIREYSTDPGDAQYTVIHEYYTDNCLDGSTSTKADAKVGAVVSAADIAKVTAYNGNSYNYSGATPDSITVADDGSSVITLRYTRTVYVPPYDPGPDSDPDPDPKPKPRPPVVIIPDEEPILVEIPDEEIPVTELPDEETPPELPEEDVPLADIPETGDAMAFYSVLGLLPGVGLAVLGFTGRKRREEDAK